MERTKRLKQGAEKLRNIAKRLRQLSGSDVPKDYRHGSLPIIRITGFLANHFKEIDTRFDIELKLRQAEVVRALEDAGVWETIRKTGENNRPNPEGLTESQCLLGLQEIVYPDDIFSEDPYVYDSARFKDYVIPCVAPLIGEPPPPPPGRPPEIPIGQEEHEDNAKVLKLRVQYYADACDKLADLCERAAAEEQEASAEQPDPKGDLNAGKVTTQSTEVPSDEAPADWLRVCEAARKTLIPDSTLSQACRRGNLRSLGEGRSRRIDPEDLERYKKEFEPRGG